MAEKYTIKLDKRTIFGRKTKSLRRQSLVPANIYGKKTASISTQVDLKQFTKLLDQAGETSIVYVSLTEEKKERPCLIANVQVDPVTDNPIHVDFRQVDLTEKVTANIPVELTGEAPAAKDESATIVTQLSEIEVTALPTDLPENFTIDISQLTHIGDNIKVSQLKYDHDKVTIDLDPETIIVSTQAQQEEEVVPPPVSTEGEVAPATPEGEEKLETQKEGEAKEPSPAE